MIAAFSCVYNNNNNSTVDRLAIPKFSAKICRQQRLPPLYQFAVIELGFDEIYNRLKWRYPRVDPIETIHKRRIIIFPLPIIDPA